MKILDHANALDYTFDEVLEWAQCPASAKDSYSYNLVDGLLHSKNVDAPIDSVAL
jgi:hypothetical protein